VGKACTGDHRKIHIYKPSSARSHLNLRTFIAKFPTLTLTLWRRISPYARNIAYKTCVLTVVIEIMSDTDSIDDLQAKVTTISPSKLALVKQIVGRTNSPHRMNSYRLLSKMSCYIIKLNTSVSQC
jgi:hypothetical protein